MDTAAATQTYSNQFRMAIYDFGASAQHGRAASPVLRCRQPVERQDRRRQYRPDDRQWPEREQRPGHPIHQHHFPRSTARSARRATGTSAVAAEISVLRLRRRCRRIQSAILPQADNRQRIACQSPINPALCTTIKDRDIKIAVLYTTYLALPTNAWYNTWIAPFNTGPYGPVAEQPDRAEHGGAARRPACISRSARPRASRRR